MKLIKFLDFRSHVQNDWKRKLFQKREAKEKLEPKASRIESIFAKLLSKLRRSVKHFALLTSWALEQVSYLMK